jgi:hypothetical protein
MLGKSLGCRALVPSLLVALVMSCAHNVRQDKATGEDGKIKGARTLELENGEAKATGIVTYPGGDRVDWKVIELPENKKGTLEIKLQWTPPRPGLQLAFDVFDEWNHPVGAAKATKKKKKKRGSSDEGGSSRSRSRMKRATINDAKGKYFIRVYAVGRGDAGKYKLSVEFQEEAPPPNMDVLAMEFPDPPKLPGVPQAEVPCDPMNFDPKNPACIIVCPVGGPSAAPPGWKGCQDVCPNPPDANLPACQKTMPCPNPPDRRVRACKPSAWPKCDLNNPDPQNPNCDNAKPDPVITRVLTNVVENGEMVITIAGGTNNGIKKDWKGVVLRGQSDDPLPGGEIRIFSVDKSQTRGRVRLTADQLKANNRVKLSPP